MTCHKAYYLGYGQSCDRSFECTSALECVDGECVNPTYPICSINLNINGNCKQEETCFNGACVPRRGLNEDCKKDNDCEATLTCMPKPNINETRTCQPLFSRKEGLTCSQDYDCDIADGLYCGLDGYCNKLVPIPSSTNCMTETCQGNGTDYRCDCTSSDKGECTQTMKLTSQCKEAMTKYTTCTQNNRCPQVFSIAPGTCQHLCRGCGVLEHCSSLNTACGFDLAYSQCETSSSIRTKSLGVLSIIISIFALMAI
eukprot:gene20045-24035_t